MMLSSFRCDFDDTAQYRVSAMNSKGELSAFASVVVKSTLRQVFKPSHPHNTLDMNELLKTTFMIMQLSEITLNHRKYRTMSVNEVSKCSFIGFLGNTASLIVIGLKIWNQM